MARHRAILALAAGVALNLSAAADPDNLVFDDFALAPRQPPQPPAADAAPKSWFQGWDGSVELGLTGSQGNSSNLSFRTGISGQRTTQDYDTRILANYIYASEDGAKTDHRFRGEVRNDWLLKASKWRVFAQGAVDIDEFKNWEWRLQAFAGVGYEFIKTEKTELIGRLGAGASREFGGDETSILPEALVGLDFMRQLTERQKFTLTGELYPSLSDGGEFRALVRANYEILVDPEVNMTLKLGIEDRYDSDPGPDTQENDLDYFVMLVWSF